MQVVNPNYRLVLLFLCLWISLSPIFSQARFEVEVLGANVDSDCFDIFSPKDVHWGVSVEGNPENYFPVRGTCFADPPATVWISSDYDCPDVAPADIEICFEVFEDDGTGCVIDARCLERICARYPLPYFTGDLDTTLSLPNGLSSSGTLDFAVRRTNNFLGGVNDLICGAIDLGMVPRNGFTGDRSLGVFNNFCASNANEPNPTTAGVRWFNNSGVWFKFTTSANPGSLLEIVTLADPSQFGDDLNIQLALYTSRGDCTGPFDFVMEHWNENDFDEYMLLECPLPNQEYYILVDGVVTIPSQLDGFFSVEVRDHGVSTTPNDPCLAEDLGSLQMQTSLQAQMSSNFCADNLTDPVPSAFTPQHGVWFSFVAPDSRNVSIQTTSDQAYPAGLDDIDPAMALFRARGGDCNQLEEVESQNSSPGNGMESMDLFCLTPGERYWLMVDGAGSNLRGVFEVAVTALDPTISREELDLVFCEGDSMLIGSDYVYEAGPYAVNLLTAEGCDSLVFGSVTLIPPVSTFLDTTLCAGETIVIGNQIFGQTGSIMEILSASSGCDSIVSGQLNVREAIDTTLQIEICAGNIAVIGGQFFTAGGNHTVVVPAANGCDSTINATVVVRDSFLTLIDTAICFGEELSYVGDVLNVAGAYRYDLLSAGGCDSTVLLQLSIFDLLSGRPSLTRAADGLAQAGGILSVNPIGGSGNYTIQWSNGDEGLQADSLVGGQTYCVSVSDDIGCTYDTCMLMSFPILIDSEITVDSVKCKGQSSGNIIFTARGGEAPYNYIWRGLATGVTGSGSILLEGGNAQIANVPEDEYEIIISDRWGENSFRAIIAAPPLLSLDIVQQIAPQCFQDCNGSVSILINGGTPPFLTIQGIISGRNWQINNLCATDQGVLQITDVNACPAQISYTLEQAPELTADWMVDKEVRCFGEANGKASISTNANSPTYEWSNGETSNPAINLEGGPFSVTVTDIEGCTTISQGFMPAPEAPLTGIVSQAAEVDCKGDSTAILRVENDGLNFLWSTGHRTQTIENLPAGIYTVTITNDAGCEDVVNYTISEPFALSFELTTVAVNCWDGPSSGSITVSNEFGGTPPYLYGVDDSPLQGESLLLGLEAGIHEVLMEDSRGCQLSQLAEIDAPAEVIVNLGEDREMQLGTISKLTATSFPSSGLIYTWRNSDTLFQCIDCPIVSVTPTATTLWEVNVQDTTTGCVAGDEILLEVIKTRAVFLPNAFSPNGDGVNDYYQIYPSVEVAEMPQLVIYDRWGAEMYRGDFQGLGADDQGWNGMVGGEEAPSGVYVIAVEVQFKDGHTEWISQDLTLLR